MPYSPKQMDNYFQAMNNPCVQAVLCAQEIHLKAQKEGLCKIAYSAILQRPSFLKA